MSAAKFALGDRVHLVSRNAFGRDLGLLPEVWMVDFIDWGPNPNQPYFAPIYELVTDDHRRLRRQEPELVKA